MSEETSPLRLALLIDSDNVPAACADGLMQDVSHLGQATVREAYGEFRQTISEPWSLACQRHDIREIQYDQFGRGKNAADIAICIRAMDLLHSRELDGLALASGDSDFLPLVNRFTAAGLPVYLFAQKHAPERLRDAATRFVHVENLLRGHPVNTPGSRKKPLLSPTDFMPDLHNVIVDIRDEDGRLTIEQLHRALLERDRHFDPRSFGYRHLIDLVALLPHVVIKRSADGEPHVRLKKKRPRKRRSQQEQ